MSHLSSSLQTLASDLNIQIPRLAGLALGQEGDDTSPLSLPNPVPVAMQLLLPSSPWDWPTDPNGTSSAALYDFCSWMPDSSASSRSYQPSAFRFSDSYNLFLQCLKNDALTSKAQASFAETTFYTTVLYAESNQPKLPAWNVSQFPQTWIASVSGGSATAGTIRVRLPPEGESTDSQPNSTLIGTQTPNGSDTPVPLRAGAVHFIDIHADAWDLISIRPSGWCDTAFVQFKQDGPYTTGNANRFFGAQGMLRNLITGIYVALNPSVTVSATPKFTVQLQQGLSPEASLRVGGLVFDHNAVTFPGVPAAQDLTATESVMTTTSPLNDAIIIGITVAQLGS